LKIRHYGLLILTLLTIAFLQPLVLLLGGFALLGGVAAFIFADLPPENQDAWEMKVTGLLKQLRLVLTRQGQCRPCSLNDPRQPAGNAVRHESMPPLEESTGRPSDRSRPLRG
jgi:hypothetical protein